MSAVAIRVEANRMLKHPKVTLQVTSLKQRMADQFEVTADHITRMLLEDRALAHQRGHSQAAINATMGLAKMHGLLEARPTEPQDYDDLTDEELYRIIREG